jgi:hypothetical protein
VIQLVEDIDGLDMPAWLGVERASTPQPCPRHVTWIYRVAVACLITGIAWLPLYIYPRIPNRPAPERFPGTGIRVAAFFVCLVGIGFHSTYLAFVSDKTLLGWASWIGTKNPLLSRIVCLLFAILGWFVTMMALCFILDLDFLG